MEPLRSSEEHLLTMRRTLVSHDPRCARISNAELMGATHGVIYTTPESTASATDELRHIGNKNDVALTADSAKRILLWPLRRELMKFFAGPPSNAFPSEKLRFARAARRAEYDRRKATVFVSRLLPARGAIEFARNCIEAPMLRDVNRTLFGTRLAFSGYEDPDQAMWCVTCVVDGHPGKGEAKLESLVRAWNDIDDATYRALTYANIRDTHVFTALYHTDFAHVCEGHFRMKLLRMSDMHAQGAVDSTLTSSASGVHKLGLAMPVSGSDARGHGQVFGGPGVRCRVQALHSLAEVDRMQELLWSGQGSMPRSVHESARRGVFIQVPLHPFKTTSSESKLEPSRWYAVTTWRVTDRPPSTRASIATLATQARYLNAQQRRTMSQVMETALFEHFGGRSSRDPVLVGGERHTGAERRNKRGRFTFEDEHVVRDTPGVLLCNGAGAHDLVLPWSCIEDKALGCTRAWSTPRILVTCVDINAKPQTARENMWNLMMVSLEVAALSRGSICLFKGFMRSFLEDTAKAGEDSLFRTMMAGCGALRCPPVSWQHDQVKRLTATAMPLCVTTGRHAVLSMLAAAAVTYGQSPSLVRTLHQQASVSASAGATSASASAGATSASASAGAASVSASAGPTSRPRAKFVARTRHASAAISSASNALPVALTAPAAFDASAGTGSAPSAGLDDASVGAATVPQWGNKRQRT